MARIARPTAPNASTRVSSRPRSPASARPYISVASPAASQEQAGHVETAGVRLLLFLQEQAGEDEAEHADRDVDQEDPAPVLVLDQVAAEDGAAGRGHDHRDHEDRGALGALVRWEGAEEHRGADGREHAAADALQDAEGDQRFDAPGEAAGEARRS